MYLRNVCCLWDLENRAQDTLQDLWGIDHNHFHRELLLVNRKISLHPDRESRCRARRRETQMGKLTRAKCRTQRQLSRTNRNHVVSQLSRLPFATCYQYTRELEKCENSIYFLPEVQTISACLERASSAQLLEKPDISCTFISPAVRIETQ